jgi:hypothetical protein
MSELFKSIVPSILQTKQEGLLADVGEDQYVAFVVNRALSYHRDTVFQANAMNVYPGLDKKLQYDFLLNTVRGYKRRYVPWPKKAPQDDLEAIKKCYGCSTKMAHEMHSILKPDQIETIRKIASTGE